MIASSNSQAARGLLLQAKVLVVNQGPLRMEDGAAKNEKEEKKGKKTEQKSKAQRRAWTKMRLT